MNKYLMSDIVKESIVSPVVISKSKIGYVDWWEQLCALVSAIPFVGGTFATELQSIRNSVTEYKAHEFFRKFTCFIYELEELTEEQRNGFIRDIEKAANDTSGNVVMGLVDRIDNINKEKILANLVKAKVVNEISVDDFFRLSSMLERIPYVDLVKLELYNQDYYDEDGDSELLYATGALQQSIIDAEGGNKYVLSKLGKKLLIFGLHVEVSNIQLAGTKVANLEWGEVKGIESISNDEIDNLFKEAVRKQSYVESDQAMFDYDVNRGGNNILHIQYIIK